RADEKAIFVPSGENTALKLSAANAVSESVVRGVRPEASSFTVQMFDGWLTVVELLPSSARAEVKVMACAATGVGVGLGVGMGVGVGLGVIFGTGGGALSIVGATLQPVMTAANTSAAA